VLDWAALLAQAALTVVGVVIADRARVFRARPFATGLFFGAISVIVHFLPVAEVAYYDVSVSLRIVPPIVAGFFYGPVTCLTAGVLACLASILSAFDGSSSVLTVCSVCGTVAVTLYALLLGRCVFDDKRPPVCTAVIAAAYGVVVYLTFGSLFGLDNLPITLEVIIASFVPRILGVCLSVGLVAVVCGTGRGWWRGLFSSLNLAFVFIGLAVSATTAIIALKAKEEGDAIIRHAMLDLVEEVENQARYMLHDGAVNVVGALQELGRAPTDKDLSGYAEMLGVDVLAVADRNGLVVAAVGEGLRPGRLIERNQRILRRYLSMCRGDRPFVCGHFAPCGEGSDEYVKHFAFPLPGGGFLRIGYLWSKFQIRFPQYIMPVLEGRRIGETGFCLLFDETGHTALPIPDRPETTDLSFADVGLDEKDLSRPYETVFHARIRGTLCRCMALEPFGGYRLFAVLPLAETQGPALVISTLVAFVLLLICIVFRIVQIRLRKAQAKIDALRTDEERRRAEDLALARAIQRAELRTDGTEGNGYRLLSLMKAAREVGGDFYDYYELPDGRLVVTVADVSGKGIPAAFFMMKSRVTLKSCLHVSDSLVEAMVKANERLSANNSAEMFVTAWTGVYDRKTGDLEFVSAGHNPPLIRRRDGSVEWLRAPRSPAMGNFTNVRYRSARATLGLGDRLFLYTDGVNEAMNVRGELFGNGRLFDVCGAAVGPLVPAVETAVRTFAEGAEQADDITMLELEITGLTT